MKKIKKSLALLIALMTILLSFAACNSNTKTNKLPFTEDNPGEIYSSETNEENIKTDENGIKYADNEVLIVVKPNVKKSEVEKLAKKYNAEIVGYIEVTNDYQWRLKSSYEYQQLLDVVEKIQNEEIIEIAYLNNLHESTSDDYFIPNDEKWDGQWDIIPADNNWGAEAIYAPFVWQYKDYMTPVRIGLIDAMFNTEHEDVSFAEVFYNPESSKINSDHGTHVAGTMAADFNNGKGITGIYPFGRIGDSQKNIYGVAAHGTSNYESVFLWKASLAELIVRNVKVINISMGYVIDGFLAAKDEPGYRDNVTDEADVLGEFLEDLLDKGYDFVITQSAGNTRGYHFKLKNNKWICVEDGIKKGYATKEDYNGSIAGSDYDNIADWNFRFSAIKNQRVKDRIIVVGAASLNDDTTNGKYTLADFSNTGSRVDIIAPGVNIESAGFGENQYNFKDGTSMAAPHVAGAAATVWALNNELDGARIKQILVDSAKGNFQLVSGTDKRMLNLLAASVEACNTIEGENPFKKQGGMVLGRVLIGNTPVQSTKISVIDVSTNKEVETTTTNTKGSFDITLPAGEYKVTVTVDGYAPETSEEFSINNGSVVYLDDIYLKTFVEDFTVPESMVITLGELGVIEPEITPADAASYSIKWYSSDEAVATVSPTGEAGIITTLAKGTATITAELTSGDKTITKTTKLRVASKARDTVLVLDVSGSMEGEPLEEMKKSAIQFCNDLLGDEYNNRVGVVFYDDEITTINLTDDLNMLVSKIQAVHDGGTTDMEAGLSAADKMLKNNGRTDSIKNVVVMADGLPNEGKISYSNSMPRTSYSGYYTDTAYANAVVDTAKIMMNSYNLYSLGFFHSMDGEIKDFAATLMKELTNKTDGYHQVDKAEDLQFAFGDISEDINVGSKIVINIACPVDVSVTYGKETLSSSSSAFCNATSFGTLQLLGKNRDIKVVTLDSDKEYEIEIIGTGEGKMDYSVNYFDENEQLTDYRSFETVPITKSTVIKSNTNNSSKDITLNIDEDGDGEIDIIWSAAQKGKGIITFIKNPPKPEKEEPQVEEKQDNTLRIITIVCVISLVFISGIIVAVVSICVGDNKDYESETEDYNTDDEIELWYECPKCGIKVEKILGYTEDNEWSCPRCGYSSNESESEEKITEEAEQITGFIQVTNGSMNGFTVPIKDGETLYLGKDAKYANLVFTKDYKYVSRMHCTVTFNAKANKYYVTDNSSNGTYLINKERLVKGKRTPVDINTVLILANGSCTILLR